MSYSCGCHCHLDDEDAQSLLLACNTIGTNTLKNYGVARSGILGCDTLPLRRLPRRQPPYMESSPNNADRLKEKTEKQYTWHADDRISGSIQWQMQRCAVEEAKTIVIQRSATFFRHDNKEFYILCAIANLLTWSWKKLNPFLGCESTSTFSCQPSVFRRWDSHGTAP